jgi:hypothetical protein
MSGIGHSPGECTPFGVTGGRVLMMPGKSAPVR